MARTREENTKYMREYMRTYRRNVDEIRFNKGFNACLKYLAEIGEIGAETASKYKRRVYNRVDKRCKK